MAHAYGHLSYADFDELLPDDPTVQEFYHPVPQSKIVNRLNHVNIATDVFSSQIQREEMFRSVAKVFFHSFNGWQPQNRDLYNKYCDIFLNYMQEALEVINARMRRLAEEANILAKREKIGVMFSVIGAEGHRKEEFIYLKSHENANPVMFKINVGFDQDFSKGYSMNYNELGILRKEKRFVFGRLQGQTARVRKIPYIQVHPEGFLDWIEFGEIKILVRIKFKVESNTDQIDSMMHGRLLLQLVRSRFREGRTPTIQKSQLEEKIERCKNLYWKKGPFLNYGSLINFINLDIGSQSYITEPIWSEIISPSRASGVNEFERRMASLRQRAEGLPEGTPMKLPFDRPRFTDLHLVAESDSLHVRAFCNCFEVCNFDAFYHANPILRFTMFQHNHLYLSNRSSVAFYHIKVAILLLRNGFRAYGLVSSSKWYLEKFFASLANQKVTDEFQNATYPCPENILAAACKEMREDVSPSSFLQHDEPFSKYAADEFDIHFWTTRYLIEKCIGLTGVFQTRRNGEDYLKNFEKISQKEFMKYGKESFTKRASLTRDQFLFTADFDNERLARNLAELDDIANMKNKIFRAGGNPFNVKLMCSSNTGLLFKLHHYLFNVGPIFPMAKDITTLKRYSKFIINIDGKLFYLITPRNHLAQMNDPGEISTSLFISRLSPDKSRVSTRPHNDLLESNAVFLFTLRFYSLAFDLQQHCVQKVYRYAKNVLKIPQTICITNPFQGLEFIFNNQWIEDLLCVLRTHFQLPEAAEIFPLSEDFDRRLADSSAKWWNFWKMFNTFNTNDLPNLNFGVYISFARLRLWTLNQGHDYPVFLQISSTVKNCCNELIQNCRNVFQRILSLVGKIQTYENAPEVLDHLVLWMVKGLCYNFVCLAANFIKHWQEEALAPALTTPLFPLTAPGWIEVILLFKDFEGRLDVVKNEYVNYNYELNPISNIIEETKATIKQLFRNLWQIILFEWKEDLLLLFAVNSWRDLTSLHTCVGVTFLMRFFDDFRQDVNSFRKQMVENIENELVAKTNSNVKVQHWRDLKTHLQNYFHEIGDIMQGRPLISPFWTQLSLYQPIITILDLYDPQVLRIDWNQARQP